MCEPATLTAISLGISAISAGGAIYTQTANQRSQISYQDRVARVTRENAGKAADSNYAALAERVVQTRAASAQEAFMASRGADQALGQMTVGGERAGLSPGATGDLRATIALKIAEDAATRSRNASGNEQQIMRSFESVQAEQQSRLNSAMGQPVAGADYLGILGGLAQAGIQGYSNLEETRFRRGLLATRQIGAPQ